MSEIRDWYLATAAAAVGLLGDPAVAAGWDKPSALAEMTVGELAGHLARQLFQVEAALAADPGDHQPISLLDHYERAPWTDAALHDESNVRIRHDAATESTEGPAALEARARGALDRLRPALAAEPAGRVAFVPWGPWALTLDDLLVTRLLEIAVHDDDLACSVGLTAPELPIEVTDTVIRLLAQLAARRRGPAAVLRALTRAERAPVSVTAF